MKFVSPLTAPVLNLAMLSFASLTFLVDSGYAWGPSLALVILVWGAVRGKAPSANKDDLYLAAVFLLVFIIGVLDTLVHELSISHVDNFTRYLLASFAVVYFPRRDIRESYLWVGYAIGATLAGCWAVYAKFWLAIDRVDTPEISTVNFGNFSLLFALMATCGGVWARERKTLMWFMFFAATMGFLASFLSGTRGAWAAMPVGFFVIYNRYKDVLSIDRKKIAYVLLVSTVCVFALASETGIKGRLGEIASDYEKYRQGDLDTSIGLRLEMWRSGYYAFVEKPLFGWGEQAFFEFQARLVDDAGLQPKITDYNHIHNQYIQELAVRGVVGWCALMALLAVPFWLFKRKSSSRNYRVNTLAVAGMVCIISMSIFCLTQSMLRINSAIIVFLFSLVFLWGSIRSAENEETVGGTKQVQEI